MIIIADNCWIFHFGLKDIIGKILPDENVEYAEDLHTLYEYLKLKQCSLLIIDPTTFGDNGYLVVLNIFAAYPKLKILITKEGAENLAIWEYYRFGALGCISKKNTVEEFSLAIRYVFAGKCYLNNQFVKLIFSYKLESSDKNFFEQLTSKEKIISELLLQGKSSKYIGIYLQLKPSTISTYKQRIFKKLNVSSLVEMINSANRNGFNLPYFKNKKFDPLKLSNSPNKKNNILLQPLSKKK